MTTHTFETLEKARAALEAAATIDYTLCSDAPVFKPGDVVLTDDAVLFVDMTFSLCQINTAARVPGSTIEHDAMQVFYARSREAAEARRRNREVNILEAIATAVGPRAKVQNRVLHVDGSPAYTLDVREDRTSSTWDSAPTGKWSVVVGEYANRKRFPERRDGTHNYSEIARRILEAADQNKALVAAEAKRRENQVVVTDELKQSLGFLGCYAWASDNPDRPVRVNFTINRDLTIEQARALAAALDAIIN